MADEAVTKRERSARYPAVPLAEAVAFVRQMDELGIDGLTSPQIASAMGFKNVKTNTFSGRLSSARQFGLLGLADQNYTLTELAMRIIHPMDPDEEPGLLLQACQSPPLFAELMKQYAGKRLPEAEILGNVLMHKHQITASAKLAAAESFYASIQHAGVLDETRILDACVTQLPAQVVATTPEVRTQAVVKPVQPMATAPTKAKPVQPPAVARPEAARPPRADEVRLDLSLWGVDQGKRVRLRAPSSMTAASLDRFIQALRLAVQVVDELTTSGD